MRRVILLQNLRIFKAEWRDPDEFSGFRGRARDSEGKMEPILKSRLSG